MSRLLARKLYFCAVFIIASFASIATALSLEELNLKMEQYNAELTLQIRQLKLNDVSVYKLITCINTLISFNHFN